ncbi:MAG: hypothetical protein K940chlam3_01540 [Chlamydiae bacterium]|nr:hypothetical protein [Chlamydiota bacterium]
MEATTSCHGHVPTSYRGSFTQKANRACQVIRSIFPKTITEPAFERGAGFWTHPDEESKTSFLGKLTDYNSQRENWYKVNCYMAEFWCTISNAGFIYVGLKHGSPELLFAGCASAISHSIPKQWLLTVDKIGVLIVLSKLIRDYQVLGDHPWLAAPVTTAVAINLADAHLSRNYGVTWPHVVWHLSAAAIADLFLQYAENS